VDERGRAKKKSLLTNLPYQRLGKIVLLLGEGFRVGGREWRGGDDLTHRYFSKKETWIVIEERLKTERDVSSAEKRGTRSQEDRTSARFAMERESCIAGGELIVLAQGGRQECA